MSRMDSENPAMLVHILASFWVTKQHQDLI